MRGGVQPLLLLLFLLTLVLPTALAWCGLDTGFLLGISSVFYYLLGFWTKDHGVFGPAIAIAGCASLLVAVAVMEWTIAANGAYAAYVNRPESPFMAVYALTIYLFCNRFLDRPVHEHGMIELLAHYSFGIYIIHPLFLNLLYKALGWGNTIGQLPPVLFEVTTFSIALFGSIACTWVLKRLPLFKRII